jgi:hypothetical protein
MLPKLFASWLVVLVIVPFTAPFSICDVASLFGSTRPLHPSRPARSSASVTSDVAVPTALFVPNGGRVRFLPPCKGPQAELAPPSSAAISMPFAGAAGRIREHTLLGTILRV